MKWNLAIRAAAALAAAILAAEPLHAKCTSASARPTSIQAVASNALQILLQFTDIVVFDEALWVSNGNYAFILITQKLIIKS